MFGDAHTRRCFRRTRTQKQIRHPPPTSVRGGFELRHQLQKRIIILYGKSVGSILVHLRQHLHTTSRRSSKIV